jgi:hypothetical protein
MTNVRSIVLHFTSDRRNILRVLRETSWYKELLGDDYYFLFYIFIFFLSFKILTPITVLLDLPSLYLNQMLLWRH